MSEFVSNTRYQRESIITRYVETVLAVEKKTDANFDRAYLLDLIADVAEAVDGKRIKKDPNASTEGLSEIVLRR